MAEIKPVISTASESSVKFNDFYQFAWIKNMGDTTAYVSNKSGITAGGADVAEVGAGDAVMIVTETDTIYVKGATTLECHAQNFAECPFVDVSITDSALAQQVAQNTADINNIETYLGIYDADDVAGIYADFENSIYQRIGRAAGLSAGADYDQFGMYGGRKLCNLADNGTVNAWYGDEGYVEDGSNGQVMVYQPKFYYKVVPISLEQIQPEVIDPEAEVPEYTEPEGYHLKKAYYYISTTKHSGFKCHPAFIDENGNEMDGIYISAYEGSIWDFSESKYLVYDSCDFVEGTYTAGVYPMDTAKDKFSSVAGVKPASGNTNLLTRPNIETLCTNRGAGWHSENLQVASMEQMLQIIEYCGFDTQTLIGKGIDSYASGSGNEASQTGSTASLGNGTGSATSTVHYASDGTMTTDTANGKKAERYRGRENDWGNICKFINGDNVYGEGKQRGGVNYYCDDYAYAESKMDGNYHSTGITVTNASGYVRYFGWSEQCDWAFFTTLTANGATSSKPVGDYTYVTANLGKTSPAFRVAYLGGAWNSGTSAGAFYWGWNTGVGNRARNVGGRLAWFPRS